MMIVLLHAAQSVGKDSIAFAEPKRPSKELYINSLNDRAGKQLRASQRTVLSLAEQALRLSDSTGYAKGHVEALWRIGNYYYVKDSIDQAIEYYQQTLREAELIGHRKVIAFVSYNLALVHMRLRLEVVARAYAQQAVHQFYLIAKHDRRNHVYGVWLTYAYNCLAHTYGNTREYDSALMYYNRSIIISTQQEDSECMSLSLHGIGNIYRYKREYERAIQYYARSIDQSHNLNDTSLMVENNNALCEAYWQIGKRREALCLARKTFVVASHSKDTVLVSRCGLLLADLFHKMRQIDSARVYAQTSLKLIGRSRISYRDQASQMLMKIYQESGDCSKALSYQPVHNDFDGSALAHSRLLRTTDHFKGPERMLDLERASDVVFINSKHDDDLFIWMSVLSCLGLLFIVLFIQKRKQTLKKANVKLKAAYDQIEEKQNELVKQNVELTCRQEEIKMLNNNLEAIVAERTIKLKMRNDQLNEFAFFNAHKLRSPITTILGLYGLLKFCKSEEERVQVLERIKTPVEELERLSQISQRLLDDNYKSGNEH